MRALTLVEIASEWGAGVRGASLGPAALHCANALFSESIFAQAPFRSVSGSRTTAPQTLKTPHAKYMEAILELETRACAEVCAVIQAGGFPCVLTGDHSAAAGALAGLKQACPHERLGVIWIDAHPDLHTPYTSLSGHMNGMPLGIALGIDHKDAAIHELTEEEKQCWQAFKALGGDTPCVQAQDMVFIGLRDIDAAEQQLLDQANIHRISCQDLREKGAVHAAKQALEWLSACSALYVSFDVDSLDAALVPGTGTPVTGGLAVQEALDLNMALIQDPRIKAWELTELNVLLDRQGRTLRICTEMIESIANSYHTLHKSA